MFRNAVFLSLVIAFWGASAVKGENVSSNLLEKARVAAKSASGFAAEVAVMRDMAVVAVRNAMAAENDAVEAFLVAVKNEDKKKVTSASKVLDGISDSAREAKSNLETITDYVRDARLAANSAKELEKAVQSSGNEKEAVSALGKIERFVRTAEKDAKKARELADVLKKQWLLPVATSNAPVRPDR